MKVWKDHLEDLAAQSAIPFERARLPRPGYVTLPRGPVLHYLEWLGPDSAHETLLLLHGGALTAHTWDLVCLRLSGVFRCIALDLRGHGLSAWSDRYTIESWVDDVSLVAECLALDRFHLIGMSLGGAIAGHYAALSHSRAASVILVDVGPWVDFGATTTMRTFMDRPIGDLSLNQLVDAALAVSSTEDRAKLYYRYLHMTHVLPDGALAWRADRRRRHDFPHTLAQLDELANLAPRIDCPVLVVRGELSRVLTDEKTAKFAGLLPGGGWTVIAGAGHNVQEDRPNELAAVIRSFILDG